MSAVVHVVTALERGGAQRVVLDTATRLHKVERPQHVVTGGARAALDDDAARALGRRFHRVDDLVGPIAPLQDARALAALGRLLDRIRAEVGAPFVVHTASSKAGVLGRLAARSVRGAKVVHTVHGFGLDARGARGARLLEAAERVAAPAADVVVHVSQADRQRALDLGLIKQADVDSGRARLIMYGVDEARFAAVRGDAARRTAGRARFGLADDDVVATTVANMKQQKDPLFHVDVLAAWRARTPRAKLLFLGDGPLRDAMIGRARDAGVDDALVLPGFVEDPLDAYAAADAYLLASAWEGLPLTVLEATAAGLPAVVRDTGYCDDLEWATSLTPVPPGASATEFAAALVAAVKPRRRASPRLPKRFTRAFMLQELDILYDELLGRARWM